MWKNQWLSLSPNTFSYLIILPLVAINCYLFSYDFLWIEIFPIVFFVAWAVIYKTELAFLFVAFATPISVLKRFDFGLSINLPSEPLLISLMLLFFFKLLYDGRYDKSILKHPLTLLIGFNLLWVLITALTSEMFLVSIKFFTSRLWFITVAFCIGSAVFKKIGYIKWFMIVSIFPLTFVCIYTLYREYLNDWWQDYATNRASDPYFSGHGVFAAVVSLFLPFVFLFVFQRKIFNIPRRLSMLMLFILGVFIFALVMSYARAAWVGLVAGLCFISILILRIKPWMILLTFAVAFVVGLFIWDDIYENLKRNKKVSNTDLSTHIASISNISTDASNTERLNRWNSAFRMFYQRPFFGWGPGTYMFRYAPFQRSNEMTIISTNTGSLGNAHSEYIGPLAESGVLGSLSIISIVLFSIYRCMMLYFKSSNKFSRLCAAAIGFALVTYYTHGALNNYLDTDKASIPLWAFSAIIVLLDLKYKYLSDEEMDVEWKKNDLKFIYSPK